MKLRLILREFQVKGVVTEISTISSGHINTTYAILTQKKAHPNYILQKINNTVFTNVPELTENIIRITNHIKTKLSRGHGFFMRKSALTVVYTHNGCGYHKDQEGNFWRVFKKISSAKTIELLSNESQATLMGEALGAFHQLLSDLPSPKLFDTIPKFHDTVFRISQLKESISKDPVGRLAEISGDINSILSFESEILNGLQNSINGALPLRVVHQDPKLGNLLFDNDNNVLCIIDLDTTMSGYLFYDFGDAVRSSMNTSREDEADVSLVSLNMELFKAFANGYCNGSSSFILPEEIKSLAFGVKIITYEQSLRFFTDYLNGDLYYKTNSRDHNLNRARCQLELFKKVCQKLPLMNEIIQNLYSKS